MKQEISSISNEKASLAHEIESFKSILETKNALINEYKKNISEVNSDSMNALESKSREQSNKHIEELHSKIKELEDQNQSLKDSNTKYKHTILDLNEKVESIKLKEKDYPIEEFENLKYQVQYYENELETKNKMHEIQLELISSTLHGFGAIFLAEQFHNKYNAKS